MIPLRDPIWKFFVFLMGPVIAGLLAGNKVVTQFPVLKTCDIPTTLHSADCLLGFFVIFWSPFFIVGVLVFVMWLFPGPVIEPFLDPQPAPAA